MTSEVTLPCHPYPAGAANTGGHLPSSQKQSFPFKNPNNPLWAQTIQSTSQESPWQWPSTQLLNCARPGYSRDSVLEFSNKIYLSKLEDMLSKQVKTFIPSTGNWVTVLKVRKYQHKYDILKICKPKFTVEISFKTDITALRLQNFSKHSSYC